jgi:hypothetical protein
MAKLKNHQWQLYGHCEKNTGEQPVNDGILLTEQTNKLGFRPIPTNTGPAPSSVTEEYFGSPVVADLAISLIKNAYGVTEEIFNSYLDSFEHPLDKSLAEKSILDLKKINYGVAFSRSAVLKILSQPNCEGIRSYLCARPVDGLHHFSLVMVGIDINGYDLNYPPADEKGGSLQNGDKAATDTKSLGLEYGNPPGGGITMHGDKVQIDEHYYLLKQAIGK